VLRATRKWWLLGPGPAQALDVVGVRRHGSGLVAKWEGCEGPEAAEDLKGVRVAVARRDFPPLPDGEYYWVDLVGMRVINRTGRELGRVKGLRTTAAHDILEIGTPVEGNDLLVPWVEPYFEGVDRESGTIRVDWEPEWLS
jgi:16S rRNA processing protein RimM